MSFDSRVETYKHIQQVQEFMRRVIERLLRRSHVHDQSKLSPPEVEYFDKYTPQLSGTTYGSEEYRKTLAEMRPAIDHHQSHNSHHPEFYGEQGIRGMTLLDLTEMLCDWKAATMRHTDGDILRSIELNQKRFGYSDELKQILLNTLMELEV